VERLRLTFRFTYAFHAREVRFECDRGNGYQRVFPETFSFHADRHDPAELFLQLDRPVREAAAALRHRAPPRQRAALDAARDRRAALPRARAATSSRPTRARPKRLEQIYADLALLSEVMARFAAGRATEDHPGLRIALFHLRKLLFCALDRLVQRARPPAYLDGYVTGKHRSGRPGRRSLARRASSTRSTAAIPRP
jgi:hypothetical protein